MTKAERLKNQKKIRKQWVKNLLSGQYTQGQRKLVITGEQGPNPALKGGER